MFQKMESAGREACPGGEKAKEPGFECSFREYGIIFSEKYGTDVVSAARIVVYR